MLTRKSFLTSLKYSSLLAVVLVLCSGQSCAPMPTEEVLGSDPGFFADPLDGNWVLIYDNQSIAPDCLSFLAGVVVSYDDACEGFNTLVSGGLVLYDDVGPTFTIVFSTGWTGVFLLTPTFGGDYLVEVRNELTGLIVATGRMQ